MTKPFIHLDETELAYHDHMLKLAKDNFSDVIVPNGDPAYGMPGPGEPLATVITNLTNSLTVSQINTNILKYSAVETAAAAKNTTSPYSKALLSIYQGRALRSAQIIEQFYRSLNNRYLKAIASCAYIMTALNVNEQMLSARPGYHQVMSYITLLSCICTFNSLLTYLDDDEDIEIQIKNIQKWQYVLEIRHLTNNNPDPVFITLHQHFFNQFQNLLIKLKKQQSSTLNLKLADLLHCISAKNKRAKEYGGSFDGKIVFQSQVNHSHTVDPKAVERLVKEMCELASQAPHRKQFLFYPTIHQGAVEVVDVEYDLVHKRFNIIELHSSTSCSQYRFLKQLGDQLNSKGLDYRIIACQTDVHPHTEKPASVYAYALAGLAAHLSYNELAAKNAFCQQPLFLRHTNTEPFAFERLEKVRWVKPTALGKKAVLMADTSTLDRYQRMLAQLTELFPDEKMRTKVLNFFCQKYNLSLDPRHGQVRTYGQDLNLRLRKRIDNPDAMEDIEQLMAKLNTQDKGQALRRATRQCPVDQFEALIKQFKDLNIGDKPVMDAPDSVDGQHYTPLHVTLQDDNDTKAAKLIVLGKATVDSKSRELYQQAAPTSKIKRNPVLGKLLQ